MTSLWRWLTRRYSDVYEAFGALSRSGGQLLSGAIAFYALLSLAPILYFALKAAASVAPASDARRAVMANVAHWVGGDVAETVSTLLENLESKGSSVLAEILSLLLLLYASTRLFGALRDAIYQVWGIPLPSGESLMHSLRLEFQQRALSFAMVVVVSVLMVVLLLLKTLLMRATSLVGGAMEGAWVWQLGEAGISLLVLSTLIFILLLVLPSVRIHWRDAATGAVQTAILLTLGATFISYYLGRFGKVSLFGAASSVVFLLLWVHYSAQVFLFGVALTAVHARNQGRPITGRGP